jgi:hypothetical protein
MTTIREYVLAEFEPSTMKDICEHGMVSGFGSLIYYSDTAAFYDKYEQEIWESLEADADEQCMTVIELLNCFSKKINSLTDLKNTLCWYAIERECAILLSDDICDHTSEPKIIAHCEYCNDEENNT